MEETEVKSKPWQWPGEWMKDEKFWKDVATRTVSGVLTVGVIYVYGLAVGYFKSPVIVGSTLMFIGAGGMVLVFAALCVYIYRKGFKKITGHETFFRRFELFLAICGALAVIGTAFLAFSGALDDMRPLFDDFLLF
jgi:hypothetical protein